MSEQPTRRRSRWLLAGALLVTAACSTDQDGGAPFRTNDDDAISADARPNVVMIYTDDQRDDDIAFMPKTRELIGEEGVTFTNSFVSLSLCCPARVAIVTGQHATNNGVWANGGPIGGYSSHDAERALPVWLSEAGYETIHIGKTMHGTGDTIPPGWSDWQKPRGNDHNMFDWVLADNGTSIPYGSDDDDYQTDVYARLADEAIAENADRPFFMKVSTSAPHVRGQGQPPQPAPRHEGTFNDPLPEPASFNIPKAGPPLNLEEIGRLRRLFRARVESLFAVDDLVETVIEALDREGILDNTIVMFSSDNGYLLGEHAQQGKVVFYEESIAVPLLIRGPGFPSGLISDIPVQNIDYPVTIADVAEAEPMVEVDGRSIMELLDDDRQDRALFIMSSRADLDDTDWWTGVRTRRFSYIRHADGREQLFDLLNDRFQLEDLGRSAQYTEVRGFLAAELDAFESCSGDSCDRDVDDDELIELIRLEADPVSDDADEAAESSGAPQPLPPEAPDEAPPAGAPTVTATGLGTAPAVSATAVGDRVDISWEAVDDATRYRVRIREVGTSWPDPIQVTEPALSFGGLAAGTTYQIQVGSRVDGSWGGPWTSLRITSEGNER
ncbi:MAG: sulfatase-like hydrolase/transferase [Ilumatobacter sp.]